MLLILYNRESHRDVKYKTYQTELKAQAPRTKPTSVQYKYIGYKIEPLDESVYGQKIEQLDEDDVTTCLAALVAP
ncbi:hypothetical protein KQX54_019676 [Cotesia glomerata]|uniref:Uncharacterized protein n=1 Tax=Cotesia glomerata TaxID=32391 RepID=A0AAV7IDU4_COTGL|nr:hypothetical protein KQX54_019676 [Cotesia glomerata]